MPAGILKSRKSPVEIGAFMLEIGQAGAEFSHLSNEPRVILKDMANSIRGRAPWGIQLGLLDQMGRYFEGASHNGRYIKSGLEQWLASRPD
jgi:hypothetical protein